MCTEIGQVLHFTVLKTYQRYNIHSDVVVKICLDSSLVHKKPEIFLFGLLGEPKIYVVFHFQHPKLPQ